MKIPNVLLIGAHEIKISKQKGIEELGAKGNYNGYKMEINIDDSMNESIEAETFMHETIEVLNDLYDLDLDHWKIQILSESLFTAIRLNKLDFIETKQYKKVMSK